jgi:hypothetical protein
MRTPITLKADSLIPGINVLFPWSQLILSGKKKIETRSYRLPQKYLGIPLALIETPGTNKKIQSRTIAVVVFKEAYQYSSLAHWKLEAHLHLVPLSDASYSFGTTTERWAWVVDKVIPLEYPVLPPKPRGIRFASACKVPSAVLIVSPHRTPSIQEFQQA